jgi:predicted DNA-binding transcriptional regulator AlpA
MDDKILDSRDVMKFLGICENTLLKMEKDGRINIDFRLGNRKKYFQKNIIKSLDKLAKKGVH